MSSARIQNWHSPRFRFQDMLYYAYPYAVVGNGENGNFDRLPPTIPFYPPFWFWHSHFSYLSIPSQLSRELYHWFLLPSRTATVVSKWQLNPTKTRKQTEQKYRRKVVRFAVTDFERSWMFELLLFCIRNLFASAHFIWSLRRNFNEF